MINNFICNTSEFFNAFSETIEKKISNVSNKVTELEILLSVLEAKLNSVPGLEFTADDLPETAPASAPAAAPATPAASAPSSQPPPPGSAAAPAAATPSAEAPAAAAAAPEPAGVPAGMVKAQDHPDYASFFKLLKVGVPPFVVQAKVSAAGLNPALIDTPDELIPV